MEKISQFVNRNLIKIAFSFTVIGFIVFIGFIAFLSFDGYGVRGKNINMNATGQVGDFIGGVVGSLWSLVSVILFYRALTLQREDLQNQREELRLGRLEFTVNRITNVIYKQAEKFNSENFVKRNPIPEYYKDDYTFWKMQLDWLVEDFYDIDILGIADKEQKVNKYFHNFTDNIDFSKYSEYLKSNILLIIDLINDKDEVLNEFILDLSTRKQLVKVFKHNIYLDTHRQYVGSFLKFKELQKICIEKGFLKNSNGPQLISDEIKDIKVLQRKIEQIYTFTA